MEIEQLSQELRSIVHENLPQAFRDFEWRYVKSSAETGDIDFEVRLSGKNLPEELSAVASRIDGVSCGPIGKSGRIMCDTVMSDYRDWHVRITFVRNLSA